MSSTSRAYVAKPEECETRWMGATWTRFLATGDDTGGSFALVDEGAKRGVSVPLHRHDDEESFYVLDGEVSFFVGNDDGVRVSAGAFAHVPPGTVHGFRIESETARYLILTTPRHAAFYRAISAAAPGTRTDKAVVKQACVDYGVEFVGPLPG